MTRCGLLRPRGTPYGDLERAALIHLLIGLPPLASVVFGLLTGRLVAAGR